MIQWDITRSLSLVMVAMATVTLAAVPGPIDPRYPDTIVDPRVRCVEDGVFPHPRNCSWYYRCVDRMNFGFFFTYYFECEAGTVFSDDMDQCIFTSNVRPPCGTYLGPGPTVSQPGPTTPTSGPNVTQTGPTTSTSGPTVTQTGGPITLPCIFNDTVCKKYEVCEPNMETLDLCSSCYMGTMLLHASDICAEENKLLDRTQYVCVSPPEESTLCETSPIIDVVSVSIPNSSTIRCSDDNIRPEDDRLSAINCEDFLFCDEIGTFLGSSELCSKYVQCVRESDGNWATVELTCPEGQMFSYQDDTCVDKPEDSETCEV